MPRVVYSRHYNIKAYGLERLHPFDSQKYGRAWKCLRRHFGSSLRNMWLKPDREANVAELQLVHTKTYLDQLRDATYLARALEVPVVRRVPRWLIDRQVLRPMRWATRGTMLAAEACLEHGLAVNLSGGYHHAKPDRGEGFCIYADVGIAVASLRARGLLDEQARVVCVDTDAHQGNGVCHTFMHDPRCFLLDIYHSQIYPAHDLAARERIDCSIGITRRCTDAEYLAALQEQLPGFLDSVANSPIGIAFYNAGTDILAGDPLGGLNISAEAILQRDLYVVSELRKRNIPTVMVLSGGYTKESYRLVADSVIRLLADSM